MFRGRRKMLKINWKSGLTSMMMVMVMLSIILSMVLLFIFLRRDWRY